MSMMAGEILEMPASAERQVHDLLGLNQEGTMDVQMLSRPVVAAGR
jgi:hypothetical protein